MYNETRKREQCPGADRDGFGCLHVSTIIEIFFIQISSVRTTTYNIYSTDLTAQIRSMITTLHTLSLTLITHHTNSPRVGLRRLPRARSQLTRLPLLGRRCPLRCCAARRVRRSCASLLARPSSQRAARPLPATRRERDARRCSATAHRRPRARRPTRVRLRRPPRARPPLTRPPLLGRRCPPRCCAARRARRSCASPLVHPSSQRAARPSPRHPPPGAPPSASAPPAASTAAAHPAAAARPPPAARRADSHERDARRRCQSRETVAVLRLSVAVDGEKDIHANRNFLPCSLCKTAREKNFLIWV